MPFAERHYRWTWRLRSSPDALWPLVSDTNRFNRDTGVPSVERAGGPAEELPAGRRLLRLHRFGVPIAWEEEPFEWTRPTRFGVVRRYSTGPLVSMRVLVELTAQQDGGTELVYEVWARPRNLLGVLAIPVQIGVLSARRFEDTVRRYDRAAAAARPSSALPAHVTFAPGGQERLAQLGRSIAEGGDERLATRLTETVAQADDLSLLDLRPYALADAWGEERRRVLELCLRATRAGVLAFRWKVLCPLCRGSSESSATLAGVGSKVHCSSCRIDFTANFERSVELTFRPSPSIRDITAGEFCVGGPQVTPHIVMQQHLEANSRRTIALPLETGRYRLRTADMAGSLSLVAAAGGLADVTATAGPGGWNDTEVGVNLRPSLTLINVTEAEQLFILERVAWNDQAVTAAEVIALQLFRDLFASEALRAGEEFSVGSMAIVFTDLRGSTKLYAEIGDAVAFGRVQDHFDVMKAAIAKEGGAIVKTIGDAVMAVFRRPVPALRAMVEAQRALAQPPAGIQPLHLKVGLHFGPCIAVTQNERLDYFGSTINIAARLVGQSSGRDLILSTDARRDPEVEAWLSENAGRIQIEPVGATLRGFDDRTFDLWRLTLR